MGKRDGVVIPLWGVRIYNMANNKIAEIVMTKRPYIACALTAALAAKNHGFRFVTPSRNNTMMQADIDFIINSMRWSKPTKYYIAPESLHLLEPVDDDLLEVGNCEYFLVAPPKYVQKYEKTMITQDNAKSLLENSVARIVLRNNLPFPAIEWSEE